MNAWTVWIAFSVSSARLLVSASRSCDERDSPRTRRPMTISGATTAGIITRMMPISFALVSPSITSAPIRLSVERRMIDRFTPEMAWTSVVSVPRRERISPVRVTS